MAWNVALVFLCWLCVVSNAIEEYGECRSLEGTWYNNLGSEMILAQSQDGRLSGEYRTATEREKGAAGTTYSNVTGIASSTHHGVFGFSVSWRGGMSTTAWTGQCLICNGVEVLMTSWFLRSKQDTCYDKWKSTYVGHGYFTRYEQRPGPRKWSGTHTPSDWKKDRRAKRETQGNDFEKLEEPVIQRRRRQTNADNQSKPPCSIDGTWYNELGSMIKLEQNGDTTITGEYMTSRERQQGLASGQHSDILGVGNPDETERTWAFYVIWDNGNAVTGWLGQCHHCESGNNTEEVLEAVWLHRSRVDSCDANWMSTLHGENSFFKTDIKPVSADNIVAGEFGEEVSGKSQQQTCGSEIPNKNFILLCLTVIHDIMASLCLLIFIQVLTVVEMQHVGPHEASPQVLRSIGNQHLWLACPPGYIMNPGNPLLTCGNNKWSGSVPKCTVCPPNTYKANDAMCAPCPGNTQTEGPANSIAECVCNKGYKQQGSFCVDINECASNGGHGPCDQACQNKDGGYVCSCTTPGYKIDPANPDRCKATEKCEVLGREDAPKNGGLVCLYSPERNERYCAVRCNAGYEFISTPNIYEKCGLETGLRWTFVNDHRNEMLEPCIKQSFMPLQPSNWYFSTRCTSTGGKERAAQLGSFNEMLKEEKVCHSDKCDIEEASVICGKDR